VRATDEASALDQDVNKRTTYTWGLAGVHVRVSGMGAYGIVVAGEVRLRGAVHAVSSERRGPGPSSEHAHNTVLLTLVA